MNNALLISHTFPPVGGGAVIRITKFVKYLPTVGWNPIVVTATLALSSTDPSLLSEVRDVQVIRTRASLIHRLRGWVIHRTIRSDQSTPVISSTLSAPSRWIHRLAHWYYRLETAVLGSALIPDQQVTWVIPAILAARNVIRRWPIRVVYTIALPNSTTFIGAFLKWRYGLPWVVDFRDVWTDRWNAGDTPVWWRKKLERWMERFIIRYADHVITATQSAQDYFIRHSMPVDQTKFTVITNGFDPDDIPIRIHQQVSNRAGLRFTCMGAVSLNYHYQTLQRFLHAFDDLSQKGLLRRQDVHVEILSNVNPNLFQRRSSDLPVEYVGFLPHRQAVEYCSSSDILFLILHPNFSGNSYPGKLFEYVALKRPILGLTADGITQQFIQQYRLGWCVDDRHSEELKKTLCEIYQLWRKNALPQIAPSVADQFNRQALTRRLAEVFSMLDTFYE